MFVVSGFLPCLWFFFDGLLNAGGCFQLTVKIIRVGLFFAFEALGFCIVPIGMFAAMSFADFIRPNDDGFQFCHRCEGVAWPAGFHRFLAFSFSF